MFQMGEIVGKALSIEERQKFDLVRLLQHGGKVVIVGGRTTNFTDEMRRDPRLEFWDSTDPKALRRELPTNTRALFFTKFISHEWDGRLRKQAKKRGVFCRPGIYDTGELRIELQRVVDHEKPKPVESVVELDHLMAKVETPLPVVEPEPEPIMEPEPEPDDPVAELQFDWRAVQPPPQRRGRGLMEYVVKHADLHAESKVEEAKRLLAQMKTEGLTSTLKSVVEFMRVAARKQGIPTKTAGPYTKVKRPGSNGAVTEPVMPVVAPPATLPPVEQLRQVRTTLPPHADALIQAIGEAEHYIEDMQAAAKLLAELMPRLKTEIAAFRDKQRRAAEIFLD